MPRRALLSRPLRSRPRVLPALAATLLAATACSDPVRLDVAPAEPGTAEFCSALRGTAPASLAGAPLREVEPRRAGLAWGDPAIVLRCGVPRPDALRPDSSLAEVDGIGWLDEPRGDGLRFTAVDLPAFVRVDVPGDYAPEADVLADLSTALRRAAGRAR